jgi:hypothetical protein
MNPTMSLYFTLSVTLEYDKCMPPALPQQATVQAHER